MKNKLAPKKVGVIGNNPSPPAKPVCPIDQAMDTALFWLDQEGIKTASKGLGQWAVSDFQSKPAVLKKLGDLKKNGVDVLLVCSDPVVNANVRHLIEAAHDPTMQMKTMHEFREPVDKSGGDQCYGPNFTSLFIQAAGIVNQINAQLTSRSPSAAAGTISVQTAQSYDKVP
jgi:hypothetical protein